jgi:plastocyanin
MNCAVLLACTGIYLEAVMSSLRFVLLSSIALAVTACGSSYSTPTPAPSPVPVTTGSSTPISIPSGAQTLGNRAFSPDALDVAAGTTVTWTNNDSIAHTSTSNGAGWDSGAIPPHGQFSMAFTNAGTFPYHCTIHPGMVGTVTVH